MYFCSLLMFAFHETDLKYIYLGQVSYKKFNDLALPDDQIQTEQVWQGYHNAG